MDKLWKTACAIVYLAVCILDFIVMPGYIMYKHDTKVEYYERIAKTFKDHPDVMEKVVGQKMSDWSPYTLRGAGMFHLSFGAILTGSILGRKKIKEENGDPNERANS